MVGKKQLSLDDDHIFKQLNMDFIPKVNIWVHTYKIESEEDEKMILAMNFEEFIQKT